MVRCTLFLFNNKPVISTSGVEIIAAKIKMAATLDSCGTCSANQSAGTCDAAQTEDNHKNGTSHPIRVNNNIADILLKSSKQYVFDHITVESVDWAESDGCPSQLYYLSNT